MMVLVFLTRKSIFIKCNKLNFKKRLNPLRWELLLE